MRGIPFFSFAGIPVVLSPWYFLLLVLGFRSGVVGGAIWVVAVTLSLLVHEFGHALTARAFALRPSVVLHGLGGATAHAEADRDFSDALIIAAGPAAGLLFGGVAGVAWLLWIGFGPSVPWVTSFLGTLAFINFAWSGFNLLPVWPMDGGKLFRLGLLQWLRPLTAERVTHGTGILVLACLIVFRGWLPLDTTFLTLLCLYMIWENYRAFRGEVRSGPIRSKNPEAKALLLRAQRAFGAGDYQEASRLAQLLRQETTVQASVLRQAWALLGASSVRLGQHQEALHYLQRAPDTQDVLEARIDCYYKLGMDSELEALLASSAFTRLVPQVRRDEILGVVGHVLEGAPAEDAPEPSHPQ